MDISARERKTLIVNIEGVGQYAVPLPSAISPADTAAYMRARKEGETEAYIWLVEHFAKYLGDAMDALTNEEFAEIVRAWNDGGEPTMGES